MKTSKELVATRQARYRCEMARCPSCCAVLVNCDYVNGSKRVQTLTGVVDVCYRPKLCPNDLCDSSFDSFMSSVVNKKPPYYKVRGQNHLKGVDKAARRCQKSG